MYREIGKIIRKLPRVTLTNIREFEEAYKKKQKRGRGATRGRASGRGRQGLQHHGNLKPLGYMGGDNPTYIKVPKYLEFYRDMDHRRQYIPISLHRIQYLMDQGRLNPDQTVDLTTLVNVRGTTVFPAERQYGVQLVGRGTDIFQTRLNLEVQWVDGEDTIAAIERLGGVVTTGWYDITSLYWLVDPLGMFRHGSPIPRRTLPPYDAAEYYASPLNRGYLASTAEILEARRELASRRGYSLRDEGLARQWLEERKHRRQIYYGLEPGWIVNVKDRVILKPNHNELHDYYNT